MAKVVNWQQTATSAAVIFLTVLVTSQCYPYWISSAAPGPADLCITTDNQDAQKPSRFHIPDYGLQGPIPWTYIRPSVRDQFTVNGSIRAVENFRGMDATDSGAKPFVWPSARIDLMRRRAEGRSPAVSSYGENTTLTFYEAFDKYPVKGKSVLVIGSQVPWLEGMLLAFNAGSITTVDFNKPIADYPGLRQWDIAELDATDETFDVAVSYSSLEHDGLGRYGDPLNPDGDMHRMAKIRGLLNPGGLFLLGVPVGNDTLVFNAHRVYGPIRMPLLLKGWQMLDVFGVSSLEAAYRENLNAVLIQPVIVLK
ncbi:hypothetical protein CLOP_g21356 [Closterium sp. NIES-67]|nr:hypothetical protein CLOP_g21356 [Closterium sp. NIES-67]